MAAGGGVYTERKVKTDRENKYLFKFTSVIKCILNPNDRASFERITMTTLQLFLDLL